MDKYIKQLLEQYSKVILPKFGAIVIEDEESGELMFNEYLNYNDGKLDELIEGESNMGLQEAQNMIAKYIRDIQAQIDKGESYDIFGLGSFSKNKDGEVEFSGNLKTGESGKTENKSSETPPVAKKNEEVQEKKVEKKPVQKDSKKTEDKITDSKKENTYVAPSTDKNVDSAKEDSLKKSKASSKDQKTKTEKSKKAETAKADKKKAKEEAKKAKEKAKQDKLKAKEEAKKKKTKAKADSKEAKTKDAKSTAQNKPNEKSKKKKKKIGVVGWIAIVLLFLAAGGSIFVGLNYEKVKSYMGWNEFEDKTELAENNVSPALDENKDSSSDLEEDSAIENTSDENIDEQKQAEDKEGENESSTAESEETENVEKTVEPEPEPEPEPVKEKTTYSSTSGSYHLIAGGYREKANAEASVAELKSKGLDAKIIGRINGLHFVSAKSYSSLGAAKQDINNVRAQAPGAWIYKQ